MQFIANKRKLLIADLGIGESRKTNNVSNSYILPFSRVNCPPVLQGLHTVDENSSGEAVRRGRAAEAGQSLGGVCMHPLSHPSAEGTVGSFKALAHTKVLILVPELLGILPG